MGDPATAAVARIPRRHAVRAAHRLPMAAFAARLRGVLLGRAKALSMLVPQRHLSNGMCSSTPLVGWSPPPSPNCARPNGSRDHQPRVGRQGLHRSDRHHRRSQCRCHRGRGLRPETRPRVRRPTPTGVVERTNGGSTIAAASTATTKPPWPRTKDSLPQPNRPPTRRLDRSQLFDTL